MVQSTSRLRLSDARRRNAGYLCAHGDAAALRHDRTAAGTIPPGPLRTGSEGPHGRRSASRRRSARPRIPLVSAFIAQVVRRFPPRLRTAAVLLAAAVTAFAVIAAAPAQAAGEARIEIV